MSAQPGPRVFAHLCTWFRTPQRSGLWDMWNSDYEQSPHDPDVVWDDGRRDIAATQYPLTDVYDSTDPAIIEWQLLLMKLAGIDGVIVDWDGRRLNPRRHEGLLALLPHLQRLDMKLMVCFEEWCGYWPAGTFATRRDELATARGELRWLVEHLVRQPFYARVRGRAPVLVFRKIPRQWFDAGEWRELAGELWRQDVSLIFPTDVGEAFAPVSDGRFFWLGGFRTPANDNPLEFGLSQYQSFLHEARQTPARIERPLVFGSVAPGFDDSPVWGWGEGARIAPRYGTQRFERMWQASIEAAVDVVQIVTWNDWNEGSQIEPSLQQGYCWLELNKRFAAGLKGRADTIADEALRVPMRILQARHGREPEADALLQHLLRDVLPPTKAQETP
jgi:hypothetical protein